MTGMLRSTLSDQELEKFRTEGMETLRSDLLKRIEGFCREECSGTGRELSCSHPLVEVIEGITDDVILSSAKRHNADLIVMGTRTHTGIGQLLLGSQPIK